MKYILLDSSNSCMMTGGTYRRLLPARLPKRLHEIYITSKRNDDSGNSLKRLKNLCQKKIKHGFRQLILHASGLAIEQCCRLSAHLLTVYNLSITNIETSSKKSIDQTFDSDGQLSTQATERDVSTISIYLNMKE
ncbi:hypothetical protein GJ496_000783 [Pomphorhynchus laevis]|nr:hypothetical protein GJ496_000783 [Pomphorhynchus laevis]